MVVPKQPFLIWPAVIVTGFVCQLAAAGDWQLSPTIIADSYLYQLKQQDNTSWDEGAALALSPSVELLFNSKHLLSSLD